MNNVYYDESVIQNYFESLNDSNVEYVLIKNIKSELPRNLKVGKDIDIIVSNNKIQEFECFQKEHRFRRVEHPWGKTRGWRNLYGLEEFEFWRRKEKQGYFYIDVAFSLACKGLMPYVWIPLDKKIQERLWKCKVWDEKNSWWITDFETRFVYLLVRSIFDKGHFSDDYIDEINALYSLVDLDVVKGLLETVFFNYSFRLLELISSGKYNEIKKDYINFYSY